MSLARPHFAISTFFRLVKESDVHFRTEREVRTIEIVDILLGQILKTERMIQVD